MLGCCSLGSPPSAVEAGRRLTRGLSLDPAFDATELAVERLAGQPSAVYDHAGDPRRVRDVVERVRVEQNEVSSLPDLDGSLATPPTAVSSRMSASDRPSPRAPSPTGIASRARADLLVRLPDPERDLQKRERRRRNRPLTSGLRVLHGGTCCSGVAVA
jgi:hypothetical protein